MVFNHIHSDDLDLCFGACMPENNETHVGLRNRRVHMANERTFLAWIRTSIGIMVFGFVVEKFALFVRRMSLYLGQMGEFEGREIPRGALGFPPSSGYSSFLGLCLIGLGALMGILAFVRYKKVEKEIETDTYQPSLILDIMLVISILIIGIFLMIYLYYTF